MILNATRIGRETCPDKQVILAFHDGRLEDQEAEALADHLGTCESCLATIETIHERDQQGGFDSRLRNAIVITADFEQPPHIETLAPPPFTAPLNRVVGEYRLERELGQGGMGIVYLARSIVTEDDTQAKPVALKILHPSVLSSAEHLQRFRTEAEAVRRLDHPNVVQLYQFDEQDGQPYFTMEFVRGQTLAQHLRRGALPPRKAAELVRVLAEAVQAAHDRQVLHRDLKPANILIPDWKHPKIVDFGLAKFIDDDARGATVTDMVLGTPAYMAPEQATGQRQAIGPTTDVYALGAILYVCLTGKPLFDGSCKLEILEQVRSKNPLPPSQRMPNIPAELEAICLRALQKQPRRRYENARDLAADLQRWLTHQRPKAAPNLVQRGLVKAQQAVLPSGLALAVIAFSGGLYWLDPGRPTQHVSNELKRGRSVVMLTPHRSAVAVVRAGEEATKLTKNDDGSLTISSWGRISLVEIMPSLPTDRYTFRAQIRHDESDFTGRIGLYAAHARYPGSTREGYQTFAGVVYNDLRRPLEVQPILPPEVAKRVAFQPTNPSHIGFGSVGDRPDGMRWEGLPNDGAALSFLPCGYPAVWRTIQLDVTPEGMTGWWNGQKIGFYPQHKFLSTFRDEWLDQQQRAPNDPYLPMIQPGYNHHGGLGLIVFQGSATFKDVELIPLPE